MPGAYGRDLDLNLLRVFAVVADTGSATEAAARLYITQPAVSAALRRLTTVVGAPLFVRGDRGLTLTSRGRGLFEVLSPHLQRIVDATLSPPSFTARTSERTLRLGLADSVEPWLLPRLLRVLGEEAPRMRVVSIPVDFRTVGAILARPGAEGVDMAATVADDLPATIQRRPLYADGFTCLHDPREGRIGRLTEETYFARSHVIVSHNGDLRGIVEDQLGRTRLVRCSVASFAHLGDILEGTALLATVPHRVADQIRAVRPHLAKRKLPFTLETSGMELLWPASKDDDEACRFVREKIVALATPRRSKA